MASNSANLCIGKAVVSMGAWVTAGGAGSLTDVGHTKGPVVLNTAIEMYEATSEQAPTPIEAVPSNMKFTVKIPMQEATIDNYLAAFRELAANKSGTPPNLTLRVGGATGKKYHQVQIVTTGVGTTLVRTITIWKATVEALSEVAYAKGGEQVLELTLNCLYDETVATADKVMKIVDA